jgi:hypothetical protein
MLEESRVAEIRSECEEAVNGPGKFESEPAWSYWFWQQLLDGGGDEEGDDGVVTFDISVDDVQIFPKLKDYLQCKLQENDQGFVTTSLVSKHWRGEVNTFADRSEDVWTHNGLVFSTEEEAEGYVRDLANRWTMVRKTRVVPTPEPITHQWVSEGRRLTDLETGTIHSPAVRVQL